MNSSGLTSFLQYLLGKLQEVNGLVDGLEGEVKSISRVSEQIRASLESKRNEGGIEKVDGQLRELNYEAEDVIAAFIAEVEERRRRKNVVKAIQTPDHIKKLQDLAKRIERYHKEVEQTLANSKTYGIDKKAEPSGDAGAAEELQRRRRDVEKDDVVGFVGDTTILVKKLTQSAGNPQLEAVSIIGMGGIGKTTLARKIYNDSRREGHFECYVWLYVSQDSGTTVFSLESDETLEVEDKGVEKLKEKLVKYLRGRKYLVVWDDIWETEVWNEVKCAFPDDQNGSKILITSRIKKVALRASGTSHPYPLSVLNQDESWKLLCKKMCRGGECPKYLEPLVREIAEGCCGLPLSIVVLGKVLADEEKKRLALKRYVGNVNLYFSECKDIMALSYNHLPERLKSCLLYFGVYPEKFEIPVRQLIQLWIAEDFMSQTSNRNSLESEAEKILEELIDQSVVQVASRRTDGGVKTCHIHDALRYFCISESKKEKFLEVINDKLSLLNNFRRLSIYYIDSYESSNPSRYPRTLFFIRRPKYDFDSNLCKWVFENFKSLRVLSFLSVDLYSIPTMIENLKLLKYLRIKSPILTNIPDSICNLIYLETLDMRGTPLKRLPKGIWKMRGLRNLYVYGPVKLPDDWDLKFERLWNLRVLSTVSLDPRAVRSIIKANLISEVRKLGIWFASNKSGSEVEDVLKHLHCFHSLEILKVINYPDRPLPNLFPPKITQITLRQVRLEVDPCMSELGKLLYLSILKVKNCLLSSVVLKVGADSFPRLECLKLEGLEIKEWEQGKGAMPILNRLVIKELFKLTKLPSTLWTTLRDVEAVSTNLELVTTLEELKNSLEFELKVDPPKDNEFYRETAVPTVPPVTSSTEAPHWTRWIQRFMVKILLCCARSRGAISTMHGSVSSVLTPKEKAMAIEIESLKNLYESQNERYQAQEQELAALKRMIMKGKQPSMGNNQEGDQLLDVEDDDNEINLFDSRAPEEATK